MLTLVTAPAWSCFCPVGFVLQTRLFQKIKRGRFSFHEQYWDPISDGAKDLISRLVVSGQYRTNRGSYLVAVLAACCLALLV